MSKFENLTRLFQKKNSFLVSAAMTAAAISSASAHADAAVQPKTQPDVDANAAAEGAAAQANPGQKVHEFHVPAGTLGEAIAEYEREAGVKVSMPPQDVTTVATKGAQGVLSLQEALTRILDGTGVAGTFLNENRVLLKLRGADQSVSVTADGLASVKYTAPLRDLPQTITVIPESIIQATASTTLVDALRTVSGISFGAGEGGNPIGDRPFIRGTDAQSSTFIDNMRDIGSQSREVFDVDSIEVSKGPSGTIVGRGTGGGAINLNTKFARHENFIHGSIIPGTSSYLRGTVDSNFKLTDSIAFRLNGMGHSQDVSGRDYVHFGRWGVAPSLALGLGKPTRAFLNYYHMIENDRPDAGVPYNNPAFKPRTDLPRLLQTGDGQPLVVPHSGAFYGLLDRDFRNDTAREGEGRVERTLTENHLVRDTYRYGRTTQNYIYTQPDDSQGNIYYGLLYRRNLNRNTAVISSINQTDFSGTFKTASIRHTYAAGAEFSSERGDNQSYTFGPAVPTTVTTCPAGFNFAADNYNCTSLFAPTPFDPWKGAPVLNGTPTHSRTGTKSGYVFDTVNIIPKLSATAGLRFDNYKSTFTPAVTANPNKPVSREDNILNYQVAVSYKPIPIANVYASVATSAVPSGNALQQGSDGSALTVQNQNLAPEKTRSEEVGTKWDVFHGKALATFAWFRADTDNARVADANNNVVNAGTKRNIGIDMGLSGNITKRWTMFGGYTHMNAIIVDAGFTNGVPSVQNGTHFPNTPSNSYSITTSYAITKSISAGGGVYGSGKVWGNQSTNKWVPGYTRVDLNGTYRFNQHFNFQANIQNVGDKIYFSNAYTTHYATMAPRRQASFGVNVLF